MAGRGPVRFFFASFLVWVAGAVHAQDHVRPVETRVHEIERFHPFSDSTTFGKLEFLGGLQIASDDPLFGGLSGLRLIGDRMIAVSDAGFWFDAMLERADERLTSLREMRLAPMLDGNGRPFRYKAEIDAEGLERVDDGWLVATERDIRVLAYTGDPFEVPLPGTVVARPTGPPLRGNRGFEAIAAFPDGPQLVLSEDSLDANGDIRGFRIRVVGHALGEPIPFVVAKRGPFAVTDAAFLPDGDLLLLERRFNLADGPGMRIRRIVLPQRADGQPLDGEVLIEVGLPHQIDNMEGIAVSPHPRGHRVTIVSDDNRSALQRTLLLEFLLAE